MTRWIVTGAVVLTLVALLVMQQRRLDRLEVAVRRAGVAAGTSEAGGGDEAPMRDEPVAPRERQIKFVPVPVPVAVPSAAPNAPTTAAPAMAPSTTGSAALPATAAAAVAPVPNLAPRAPYNDRLAQSPAQPVMADTSEPIRSFVQQNNIDQGQWNALVKANKEWVDTLVSVKQHGVTSAPGPIDQLARRHESAIGSILGDASTVESYKRMQGQLDTPRVSVQWGGKTYDGAKME